MRTTQNRLRAETHPRLSAVLRLNHEVMFYSGNIGKVSTALRLWSKTPDVERGSGLKFTAGFFDGPGQVGFGGNYGKFLSDFQTTSRSASNKWLRLRLLSGSLCVKVRPFGKSNDLCVTSVTF